MAGDLSWLTVDTVTVIGGGTVPRAVTIVWLRGEIDLSTCMILDDALEAVRHEPWFAGWHWCAYVENLGRGWGLKDPLDEPYRDLTDAVTKQNRRALDDHAATGAVP